MLCPNVCGQSYKQQPFRDFPGSDVRQGSSNMMKCVTLTPTLILTLINRNQD